MTPENIMSVIGLAVGVFGVVYAIVSNRAKARIEHFVDSELQGLAFNIDYIRINASWADTHLMKISELATRLALSNEAAEIVRASQLGARDAAAAERLSVALLSQVLTLQESRFGHRLLKGPEVHERVGVTKPAPETPRNPPPPENHKLMI